MAKNHDIHIKVTKSQREMIRNTANAHGFTSVSDYIRDVTIGKSRILEEKVDKILERVTGYQPATASNYGEQQPYKVQRKSSYGPIYESTSGYNNSNYG